MMVGITPGRSPSCFRLVSGSCLSRWHTAAPRKSQICSAARRSWGPSGSLPWLLGGSEDPWLSVPVFRRVWFYRHCLYRKYSCSPANCHVVQRCPLWVTSGPSLQYYLNGRFRGRSGHQSNHEKLENVCWPARLLLHQR